MGHLDAADRQTACTIEALAGLLVGLCNRAGATKDERAELVDMLVTLGFDDSDTEGSTLDAIERGRR